MPTTVSYGIGGFDPLHPNDNISERITDNGDGTGIKTIYNAAGEQTSATQLTGLPMVEPPSATDLLAAIPPEHLAWAIAVGATLASRAGDLYAALEDIALSNTARPAIEIVTEVALSAVE